MNVAYPYVGRARVALCGEQSRVMRSDSEA